MKLDKYIPFISYKCRNSKNTMKYREKENHNPEKEKYNVDLRITTKVWRDKEREGEGE